MKHNVDFDIVVVGGGIVGLASAYKIARKFNRRTGERTAISHSSNWS
jgi:glycine/D-amino acid oxidase-like deaminating enzyme